MEMKSATCAQFDDKPVIYREGGKKERTNINEENINNLITFIHHAYIKHRSLIKVFFPKWIILFNVALQDIVPHFW